MQNPNIILAGRVIFASVNCQEYKAKLINLDRMDIRIPSDINQIEVLLNSDEVALNGTVQPTCRGRMKVGWVLYNVPKGLA